MSAVSEVIEENSYKKGRTKMQKRGRKIKKLDDAIEQIKHYKTEF